MPAPATVVRAVVGAALVVTGCDGEGKRAAPLPMGDDRPEAPPQLVMADLPFRYPPALYARKVQANVVLRLFIDRTGAVVADSTRVEESSGHESMDSAAVRGSQELEFVPAKRRGEPTGVSVLFPVYFRHPEADPLPGDSVIFHRSEGRELKARIPTP